jgi:hypothetical protein
MQTTTQDPMFVEHYRTWVGFTRLIRYVLAFLVILLLLMAYYLV